MPCTLFVSDLHLDPERPGITKLFIDFLGSRARGAEALYILGDLFEAWIGDDDTTPMNEAVYSALQECTAAGTPVFLMHGNRDFLIGEVFSQKSGAALLEDPVRIDLYGKTTLLMHGDTLCIDDLEYLAFREQVREPRWQQEFLGKSLAERRRIAGELRKASCESTRDKPESIMDVNREEVVRIMAEHGAELLIHGHTHRPAIHELVIAGTAAQRIVLGDWYQQGSMLECTPQACSLHRLVI